MKLLPETIDRQHNREERGELGGRVSHLIALHGSARFPYSQAVMCPSSTSRSELAFGAVPGQLSFARSNASIASANGVCELCQSYPKEERHTPLPLLRLDGNPQTSNSSGSPDRCLVRARWPERFRWPTSIDLGRCTRAILVAGTQSRESRAYGCS